MTDQNVDDFQEKLNQLKLKLDGLEKQQVEQLARLDPLWENIVQAEGRSRHVIDSLKVFEDKLPGIDSWVSSMDGVLKATEEKFAGIQKHFDDYFTRNEDPAKISKQEKVLEHHALIEKILQTMENEKTEVSEFRNFIYGDGTESNLGFKKKLEDLHSDQLNNGSKLLEQHDIAFNTVYEKIEGLVQGATTIGLAKAFLEQKNSYKYGIWFYTFGFFAPVVFIIIYLVQTYQEPKTLSDAVRQFMFHLPLYGACVWLALFSGRKLNQSLRLRQEYAYKETLAKAYEGHLREIQRLPENDDKNNLLRHHLEIMIYTCAFNPSQTLDSNLHDEKPPFFVDLLQKIIPGYFKKKE